MKEKHEAEKVSFKAQIEDEQTQISISDKNKLDNE